MTKYDELTALSDKYSENFHSNKEKCKNVFRMFGIKLNNFLEAPEGRLSFAALDENLMSGEETVPINSFPELRKGHDGKWYTGIRIKFMKPNPTYFGILTLKLGLKTHKDQFILHFEKDYNINPEDPTCFDAIFTEIYKGLVEDYSKHPDNITKRYGY